MLFFTRWKAAAILLTAFVVCLCAVPNFFPESTVKHWPAWAQRHIVLGLDLQGGSHLLLQVDANAVRKERLQSLNDDVLRVLRAGAHSIHRPRHRRQRRAGAHHARHRHGQRARQAARTVDAAVRHPRRVGTAQCRRDEQRRPHHAHADRRRRSPSASARRSINRSRSSSGASTSSAWSSRPSSAKASTASWCRCRACRTRRG